MAESHRGGCLWYFCAFSIPVLNSYLPSNPALNARAKVELELIQTQMAQKPMLRAEVGMRVRCANNESAE
jgi:hypothetical protein